MEQHIAKGTYTNVTSAQYGEDLDAFLKTFVEMRDFLLSYATKVRVTGLPNAHLIVGEHIVVQAIAEEGLASGMQISDNNAVIELTAVHGSTAEGMIVKGSIAGTGDRINQAGYRVFSDGTVSNHIGEVHMENERYRLAYAIDESLRLLSELEELSVQATDAVSNADAVLITF